VTEEAFLAARAAAASRRLRGGRPTKDRVNVLSGLMRTPEGGSLALRHSDNVRYFAAYDKGRIVGTGFPVEHLEAAILRHLTELPPPEAANAVALSAAQGRVDRTNKRLAALAAELETGDVPEVAAAIRSLRTRLATEEQELSVLAHEAANPLASAWVDLRATDRKRLKAALLRTVDRIECSFAKRPRTSLAEVVVRLRDGRVRTYAVYARGDRGVSCSMQGQGNPVPWPGVSDALSVPDSALDALFASSLAFNVKRFVR